MQKTRRRISRLRDYNNNLLMLVNEKAQQINDLHSIIISNMADLVEFRDNFTGCHLRRTQEYLKVLVDQLIRDNVYTDELLIWDMNAILLSSQLHDVGKITISDTILNKPGKLTPEEFSIMKTHVQKGVEAIESMDRSAYFADILGYAKLFAGTHHEKWDGSGYPRGLKGLDIPLEGRLMAIADVYDALITVRPYKEALPAEESARIIIEGAGIHFDPVLIRTFEKLKDNFAEIALKHEDAQCAG